MAVMKDTASSSVPEGSTTIGYSGGGDSILVPSSSTLMNDSSIPNHQMTFPFTFSESKALQPGDLTSIRHLWSSIPNDPSNMRSNRVFQVDWELIKLLQCELPTDGSIPKLSIGKSTTSPKVRGQAAGPTDASSTTLNELRPAIPIDTLRNIYQALRRISRKSRMESWSRPQNSLTAHFNKQGGWQAFVLKVHQALAALMITEFNERGSYQNRPNTIMCNVVETLSLWTSIQRLIAEEEDEAVTAAAAAGGYYSKYGDELYGDYHSAVEAVTVGDSDGILLTSPYASTADEHSSPIAKSTDTTCGRSGGAGTPAKGTEAQVKSLFVSMPGGVWSGMFPSGTPESGLVPPCTNAEQDGSSNAAPSSSPSSPPLAGPSNFYVEDEGKGLMVIDADYLSMAVTSTGRFDAYLLALLCQVLKDARHVLSVQPPSILSRDWSMCAIRAQHGYRVFRDATGPYKLTKSKYEWYVTLLTSGSLRAVQDTFHDLANEIWHAQFSKGDLNSTKRLEKLLIALLGHRDDMVRSQATVFLNNLYDSHDWQQDFPFLPIVRCVGDRFTIEFTINDDADHHKGEVPTGIFLILSAPSMECSADFEVYSYHTLHWQPLSSMTEKHGAKYRRFLSRRSGGRYTWIGMCDFGVFPRCGFYDWRVVRIEPASGSWATVQSTVAEIKQTFESNFSMFNIESDAGADSTSGAQLFRSRNLWPELGRLQDATHQTLDVAAGDDFKTLPLQGRFIVHPCEARKEQIHEVVVDQYGARFGPNGELEERGSFAKVSQDLELHQQQGISAIFLSGALARDNGEARYTPSGEIVFEREDASPFAVTCRATPCALLGGVKAFGDLMKEATRLKMKILVESVARISSSRAHRKYRPHILYTIDDDGKRMMLYGSDGRSLIYEEACQLNYRKVEVWDLLIEDVTSWFRRMSVNGIKLDNAHLMPQIMKIDEDELNRLDPDGQSHYPPEEKLMGDIVLPCSDSEVGFWSSTAAQSHWPNPLLIRLCRDVWRVACNFLIIGDCGILDMSMSRRLGILSRSGVIPQMQSLPETLAKIFGKKIEESGAVSEGEPPAPAVTLNEWFETTHEDLPEGAIAVQSSCSHSSPLPALLYGRGAWAATDFLFFSSDVPSTFMGEVEGHSYRLDVANVFKTEPSNMDLTTAPSEGTSPSTTASPSKRTRQMSAARSLLNLADNVTVSPQNPQSAKNIRLMSRARSLTRFEPVGSVAQLEEEQVRKVGPEFGFDLKLIGAHYKHRRQLRRSFEIFTKGALFPLRATTPIGNPLPHVFAFCRFDLENSNLVVGGINFEAKPAEDVRVNLSFLTRHYHSNDIRSDAIFEVWNMFQLQNDFEATSCRTLDMLKNGSLWTLTQENPGKYLLGVRTLSEVLADPPLLHLTECGSSCYGFKLLDAALAQRSEIVVALYISSLKSLEDMATKAVEYRRALGKAPASLEKAISSNFVASSLVHAIAVSNDVVTLAEVLRNISRAVEWRRAVMKAQSGDSDGSKTKLPDFSLFRLLVDTGLLDTPVEHGNFSRATMFFAKINRILSGFPSPTILAAKGGERTPSLALFELCRQCHEHNALGPVVFCTAELGKWSTVGGLGVMVDELSSTLVNDLGQEAWVISPYYHKNRRGEENYLARDGIQWKFNISIKVGPEDIEVGVHEGVVRGVRLFFLHNARFFPFPYPDMTAADAVRQLVVFGKGCLETLCQIREIPQIIVSNDWTTGLVPAYAKDGKSFGSTFSQTTFFHIIHNFDPNYEGRIFPPARETYWHIHQLPSEWLVDPLWSQTIINPSRCALMTADQWGTVSWSYRDDLRGIAGNSPSPLAPLLNKFPLPFATPNGIPITVRRARLAALPFKSHSEAKGFIQKKYFGFEIPDLTIPMFAFIGRITSQKGVHLILEAAESIIKRYNHRIQILVGGKVQWSEPYSARCGNHMYSLRERYPWSFWADPNEFFSDGTLINLGADFGLMPSLFEPGGIVQHEFLVAGTPVIAFKTGGLKDTIFEFDLETQSGNGFNFAAYNLGDFIFAFERAHRVFQDPPKYSKLRSNCEKSVVSCEASATAWLQEFCRLRGRIMANSTVLDKITQSLPVWKLDPSMDATEPVSVMITRSVTKDKEKDKKSQQTSAMREAGPTPVRVKFVPPPGTRPRSVAVSGSFDDWRVRRPLSWDNAMQAFTATLALPTGRHIFKFIVDGDWVCCADMPIEKDSAGIMNNVLVV